MASTATKTAVQTEPRLSPTPEPAPDPVSVPSNQCTFPDEACSNKAIALGLCSKHYSRLWKKDQLPTRKRDLPMVRIRFYISRAQFRKVKALAQAHGLTYSALLRRVIDRFMSKVSLGPTGANPPTGPGVEG
ncbi:MAG: hypothetical protein KGI71_05100 [Patescibacteria group bacterium]|nr:hypothetical protein [Patescibacteria group bacterium]